MNHSYQLCEFTVVDTYEEQLQQQLIDLVPNSWTDGAAKVKGGNFFALMGALSRAVGLLRSFVDQLRLQFRILTATGKTLDVIAEDFFGNQSSNIATSGSTLATVNFSLPRSIITNPDGTTSLEADESYRARILAELLRERGTVKGITDSVEMLTGAPPLVVEPFNPLSSASYGGPDSNANLYNATNSFYGANSAMGVPAVGLGYYGDRALLYTFIVTITNNPKAATNAAIKALIDRIRPVGTKAIVFGGN